MIEAFSSRAASMVTLMELSQGARSRTELRVIRQFFRDTATALIPLSESIGHMAATLMEDHALPDGLRAADALIAATARERQWSWSPAMTAILGGSRGWN